MSDEEDIHVDRMIDNRKLIKEVKRRPCIYDKHVKEYTNSGIKQIKWREVAEIIFAKYWNNWSKLMKDRAVEFTIKRWCNLRNCFLRELRKIVTHKGYKLRRQYIYFNDLIFLKDHIEKREQYELGLRKLGLDGSGDIKTEETSDQEDDDDLAEPDEDDDDCQGYDYEYLDEEEAQEVPVEETISVTEMPQSSRKRNTESYADNPDPLLSKQAKNSRSKLSISNDRNTNIMNGIEVPSPSQINVDPDLNFALSLVPMLRSMSQKEKIDAQIQILSVFKNYNCISTD